MNFREKASLFYFKFLTGTMSDWVTSGEDDPTIDPDVKALAVLLEEVYKQGQQDALAEPYKDVP